MLEVDGTLEIRDSATFYRGAKFLKSNPNTRFLIEGTNKTMFYGNLNEDKIGIGTTLPTKTLDVNGTLNATDSVTFGNTLSVTGNITENGLNVLTSSDTASMLTPYFRDADTSLLNLTSRFATKLNISDTASMLTNYLRTGVAASTYQTKLTNPITGTGTINYIPKFTASNTLGNANLFTNGNRLVQNEGEDLSFGSDYMGNTSNPFIGNNVKAGSVGETIQRIASTTLFNPSAIIFGFQRVNNSSGATSLGGINFMTTSGNPSGDINPIDSSRMFIEPRGNIGIGTMQPSYKFDIRGTLNATGATTLGSTLAVTGNITEGGNNVLTSGDTTSMLTPYWRSGRFSGVLPVANGGTNRTTMPAGYLLHGDGTSVDTSIGLFYDNTNKRLGIGTNNPQSPLQVDGTLTKTTTNFWHYLMFDNTAPAVGVGAGFMFGGLKTSTAQEAFAAIDGYKETSSVTPGLNAAGAMRFHTQVTTGTGVVEGMRLNSTQELGIGYGATDNGAYKLQVNSQIFATNSLIATSDLRFKENIQPLDKGLEIINKLKPVKFNFISTTENNFSEYDEIGFIAQDVEGALTTELFAKAVVKKFDEGKEDSPLGLMTEKLIPILVKAIQEQQALIKALEQRILTLENK
jgi:hypothetical protein